MFALYATETGSAVIREEDSREMTREELTDLLVLYASVPGTIIKNAISKTNADMNMTQKRTLLFLYRHEGLPMKYYSRMVNLESGSFTYAAHALEQKGLIERRESPDDHRKKSLILTPKGRAAAAALHAQLADHLEGILSVLTPAEKKKLFSALQVLYETRVAVEDRGDGPI